MHRFLDMVDTYVELNGLSSEVEPPDRPQPFRTRRGHSRLNLRSEGISTVILATGFRPHHPWLRVPVLDERGAIRQSRGVTAAPGLYVVGQRYQRHRGAPFIDSARHSAHDVVTHLCTGDLAAACVPEPS
jgi:putative flavoprotein involved in K+ transport